jgi:hypothetical protein
MNKLDNDLIQNYVARRQEEKTDLHPPHADTTDGLGLWIVLCLLVFACIIVNYWASVQIGVE